MTAEKDTTFIGSLALLTALYDTYVEHIGVVEPDGPDGPYMWCACGWRSDDLGSNDNPGDSYAVHLTNAQHAAGVKVLQPIVRRVTAQYERPALLTEDETPASSDDTEALGEFEREALLIASHTVEPVQDTGKALFFVVERIVAERERAAEVRALREAADEYPAHVRDEDEFWSYNTTADAVEEIAVEFLRDRADRIEAR